VKVYCLKCRTTSELDAAMPTVLRSGRYALRGKCPGCGAVVSKLVGMETYLEHVRRLKGEQEGTRPSEGEAGAQAPALQKVSRWRGLCRKCGVEREHEGEYFGTTWDGRVIVKARCMTCLWAQKLVNPEPVEVFSSGF